MNLRERGRASWICLATASVAFTSVQGRAQTRPAPNPNRTVNLNYVYAAGLGFGGYSLAGLSADVYTLPLQYTLRGLPYHSWSLTILAPIQGGIYRLRAIDTNGQQIAITSSRSRWFRARSCGFPSAIESF